MKPSALFSVFTRAAAAPSRRSVPGVTGAAGSAVTDYRAVEVVPGDNACLAACAEIGERHLMREAPRLPLTDCTASDTCSCKFRNCRIAAGKIAATWRRGRHSACTWAWNNAADGAAGRLTSGPADPDARRSGGRGVLLRTQQVVQGRPGHRLRK